MSTPLPRLYRTKFAFLAVVSTCFGIALIVLTTFSEAFIDTAADLHAVDYEAVGLGTLGKPDGFLQRQVVGWMKRWEAAKTREVPLMEKLGQWFLDHMPRSQPPVLLHNDFYLHNMMLDFDDPGHVVGVFDWEMSTIGDPLADLGWKLSYWPDPSDDPARRGVVSNLVAEPGYLTRRQMLERYESKTGRTMSDFAFYHAFALFKLAIIMEGSYARFLRGQTDDPIFILMKERVPALAEAAWAVCNASAR